MTGRSARSLTIREVRTRFEQWRRNREKKAAIPDELWSAAVEIARRDGVSHTIEGVSFSTGDEAVTLLESIADAVFFEIDVRFDITLGLRRGHKEQPRPLSPPDELSRKPLQFPEYRYEKHPISLYWYARRALGMPLLQFLAFYQTIEYYFPMYSRNEAIKR